MCKSGSLAGEDADAADAAAAPADRAAADVESSFLPPPQPLMKMGCGCRGSAGWVHKDCAVLGAAAQQERAGTWAGAGRYPWQLCPTCKLPYTGALKIALATEWHQRCSEKPSADPEAFAASTAYGNALASKEAYVEAEAVVRRNLATATALHGAQNRMTLGTRM